MPHLHKALSLPAIWRQTVYFLQKIRPQNLHLNNLTDPKIYEKITFESVRQLIEKIFQGQNTVSNLNLGPDSIHKFAELSGIDLKWRPILNWGNCFEDNTYEYSVQDFLEIAFAKVKPSSGETIILTSECFKDEMAFSIFNFKDVIQFMDVVYPNLFDMQFPQPSDFIFIQPDIDLITMIQHEGVRTKYCRS